jgi:type IV pilus assembly protein PilE
MRMPGSVTRHATHGKMRGITLLELLTVLVIIGIIVAFAYPSYRDFVESTKRTEAKAILLEIGQRQERFYTQNNRYGTLAELGYPEPLMTNSGAYEVIIGANDANNFTATAQYQLGGNEAGKCLTLSNDGRGMHSSAPLADCWTRTR